MLGIILGESVFSRSSGVFKKKYQYFLNLVLLIIITTVLVSLFSVREGQDLINAFVLFSIGFMSIITSSFLTSLIGVSFEKTRKKLRKEKDEGVLIMNLIRNLKKQGLSEKTIGEVLISSGFNKRKTKNYLSNNVFEKRFRTKK